MDNGDIARMALRWTVAGILEAAKGRGLNSELQRMNPSGRASPRLSRAS